MIESYYINCIKKTQSISIGTHGQEMISYIPSSILGYLGSSKSYTANLTTISGKDTFEYTYNFYTSTFNWKIGDIILYEGYDYEVVSQSKNTAHKGHHCKLLVKRIDNVKDR